VTAAQAIADQDDGAAEVLEDEGAAIDAEISLRLEVLEDSERALTPERFRELVEEGAELGRAYDKCTWPMRHITTEDWQRRQA
jgi:hypothetical protein